MLGKGRGLVSLFSCFVSSWVFAAEVPARPPCLSAREFVTIHGFLSDKDRGAIPQDEVARVAAEAAAGCENAAKRFINTFELLSRVNLIGKERVGIARQMALGTDEQAEAFAEIFRAAFLESHLDLDLLTSLRMAKELSLGFSGRTREAAHDFKDIVKFCVSREGLGLSRPVCGEMARRWTKYGEGAASGSMAESARSLWAFLTTEEDGPKLIAGDALKVLDESLTKGPEGYENFRMTYRFAMNAGNPLAERSRAVDLARRVANASLKNTTPPTTEVPISPKGGAAGQRP